jgi:uncharacterized membrane protein
MKISTKSKSLLDAFDEDARWHGVQLEYGKNSTLDASTTAHQVSKNALTTRIAFLENKLRNLNKKLKKGVESTSN